MKLNIVGDVCLRGIERDNFSIDEQVRVALEEGDLNVANLESPLTTTDRRSRHRPIRLRGKPEMNEVIELFDVYSLANNHLMDYTDSGYFQTVAFLRNAGKRYFGAGRHLSDAYRPLLIDDTEIKLAFLGFTRFDNATLASPGTTPENIRRLSEIIAGLKEKGYFVIVCPHWNYQWVDYPSPDERKKGKQIIDAGADIIVGAHPHIVQGYEQYRGKYIFHSIGNFIFKRTKYSKPSSKLGRTLILSLFIKPDHTYSFEIVPVFSDSPGMRRMTEDEETSFRSHLEKISRSLEDDRAASKLFYSTATMIDKNTGFVFEQMKNEGGFASVLSSYRVATKQDLKKRLYSAYRNSLESLIDRMRW